MIWFYLKKFPVNLLLFLLGSIVIGDYIMENYETTFLKMFVTVFVALFFWGRGWIDSNTAMNEHVDSYTLDMDDVPKELRKELIALMKKIEELRNTK
jgi:hypothetical protein